MGSIFLKKGRDKLSKNFHPWVYSQAIEKTENASSADVVKVFDSEGKFIAYGFYNSNSKIAIRLCEWNENKKIDKDWFSEKINEALNYRKFLNIEKKTNCYRIFFSEADNIPGLVVDRYGEYYVIQVSVKAIENYIDTIIDILKKKLNPQGIYLKIDEDFATKEKLKLSNGLIYGHIPEEIEINENEIKYIVNLKSGQKTGFFIDQRNNREKIRKYVKNKSVLDVFCYSGGFSLNSFYGGAKEVFSLDSSKDALFSLEKNVKLNGFSQPEVLNGDAFLILRELVKKEKKFDVIILDPPKLSKKDTDKERALRAYKDLNMQAMKLLTDKGILFTFSCSGNISRDDLKKAISWASIDSGRIVKIVDNLFQSEDHPIRLSYPESEYLKGFICFVE
ncbi:MAG: class I SAM-dependent rRNA methyltransferase [Brevinematales bacterium]|nr:class I SAM-dependent rRNA methyltransferase [Brevinematales bacterium]